MIMKKSIQNKIEEVFHNLAHNCENIFEHIHGDCNLTHFGNCFKHVGVEGLWLEFGVFQGKTIGTIADYNPAKTVYGFDSFEGLPEFWTAENPKGAFSLDGKIPPQIFRGLNVIHGEPYQDWNSNIQLIQGWFEDTLPGFIKEHPEPVAFMHIDSDLYSSCKTILDTLKNQIVPGTVICFDDWAGYPANTDIEHEPKAFAEFLIETGLGYKCLSYQTHEHYSQVGFLIEENNESNN
jgi:hypothetical protein